MSKDERLFLDELRAKSIEAAAEIMEGLQRLKLLYEEIGDDGRGLPLPRIRSSDFFYRLARFELEHAANVIRLGNSQAELIFDHVRQLARRTKGASAPMAVVELAFDADANAFVGSFEIKNPFERPADARFEVSELRDNTGKPVGVRPDVSCGVEPVEAYRVRPVELALGHDVFEDASQRGTKVLFGEVTVFLVADVERQVAKRAIKIRPQERK